MADFTVKQVNTSTGGMGRDFAGTFAASLARLVCSGITGILIARMLGPQTRGEFALILLWSQACGLLAMLGTNEAVSYYATAEPANASRHLRTGLRLCARLLLVAVPLGMLAVRFLLRSTGETARTLAVMLIPFYLPLAVLYALTQGFLQGQRRFRALNSLLVTNDATYCVLAVVAFLSRHAAPPLLLAVLAFAAGSFATAAVALHILLRSGQMEASPHPDSAVNSDVVGRYGRSVAPANWVTLLSSRMDEMVCSQVLSVHDLGIYSVAKTTIVGVNAVPIAFSTVMLPRVVAAHRAGTLRPLMKKSALFTGCCLLAVLVPSLLAMPYLLPLVFGKQFADGILTARLLLTAAAFAGMTEVAITTLKGTNQLRLALSCRAGAVATLFVGLVVLVGPMGLAGVGSACIIAGVVGAAGTWAVVVHTTGRRRPVSEFATAAEVLSA